MSTILLSTTRSMLVRQVLGLYLDATASDLGEPGLPEKKRHDNVLLGDFFGAFVYRLKGYISTPCLFILWNIDVTCIATYLFYSSIVYYPMEGSCAIIISAHHLYTYSIIDVMSIISFKFTRMYYIHPSAFGSIPTLQVQINTNST